MTKHYHVMMGPMMGVIPANLKFNQYEESIATYIKLARQIFEGQYEEKDLTIEQMVINTVDSEGIYMGVPSMAVLWTPCDDEPCSSPAWN